jgi:cell division protein FtsX
LKRVTAQPADLADARWRRRAQLAAALAIVTAALTSLAVPGGANQSAPRQVAVEDLGESHLQIFMRVKATQEQITNVRKILRIARGTVNEFAYLDKQDAYKEFKRLFRDSPDLVKNVDRSVLPVSFKVNLQKPVEHNGREVLSRVENLLGVDEVKSSVPALRSQLVADQEAKDVKCGHEPNLELEVFLNVSATPDDERRVQDALQALPGVTGVHFISHDEALVIYQCVFAGDPTLAKVQASDLPASFEITLAPSTDKTALKHTIEAIPGVDDVE